MNAKLSGLVGLVLLGSGAAGAAESEEALKAKAIAHAYEVEGRVRYDPGLSLTLLTDVRSYEGLVSAGSGPALNTNLGVGVGYTWDLIDLRGEFQYAATRVGEGHPVFLRVRAEYAFMSLGGFHLMGDLAPTLMLDGPATQAGGTGGKLAGPDLGLSARYRITANFDAFVSASGAFLASLEREGSRRFFFNPGVFLGVQVHPFGKEE
jgi:hypothetical protein